MSYGTFSAFSPVDAPVPREDTSQDWPWPVVLLIEVLASALASFLILVTLLSLTGIHFSAFNALGVTFGFTCLVFALIDGSVFLWYRAHGHGQRSLVPAPSGGELAVKSRPLGDVDVEAALHLQWKGENEGV
jgi:hypothetical protein